MVESANVIGTRSVSAFSVAMPKKLAFNGCTEKYLFRVYLGQKELGLSAMSRERTKRHGPEPNPRAHSVRPCPPARAAGPCAALGACDLSARPRCRGSGRAAASGL